MSPDRRSRDVKTRFGSGRFTAGNSKTRINLPYSNYSSFSEGRRKRHAFYGGKRRSPGSLSLVQLIQLPFQTSTQRGLRIIHGERERVRSAAGNAFVPFSPGSVRCDSCLLCCRCPGLGHGMIVFHRAPGDADGADDRAVLVSQRDSARKRDQPAIGMSMPNSGPPGCDNLPISPVFMSKNRAVLALRTAMSIEPSHARPSAQRP